MVEPLLPQPRGGTHAGETLKPKVHPWVTLPHWNSPPFLEINASRCKPRHWDPQSYPRCEDGRRIYVRTGEISNGWKWQLVWLLYSSQLPGQHSVLGHILLREILFGIKNSAASTKPRAARLSQQPRFCWQPQMPRSVHVAHVLKHRLNPVGLDKCLNTAHIFSALYMQNTCIVPSPNSLFSHNIALSAGRTRQMNLLANDLCMRWYLMNCGLYIHISLSSILVKLQYARKTHTEIL